MARAHGASRHVTSRSFYSCLARLASSIQNGRAANFCRARPSRALFFKLSLPADGLFYLRRRRISPAAAHSLAWHRAASSCRNIKPRNRRTHHYHARNRARAIVRLFIYGGASANIDFTSLAQRMCVCYIKLSKHGRRVLAASASRCPGESGFHRHQLIIGSSDNAEWRRLAMRRYLLSGRQRFKGGSCIISMWPRLEMALASVMRHVSAFSSVWARCIKK